MTDTKIFVSKNVHGLTGVTASYNDPNPVFLKVVAVRTFSTQQDGTIAFTDGGITDIAYASQEVGTTYTGTLSSITSVRSDRLYALEVSNIFGDPSNPTLMYDSGGLITFTEPVDYTPGTYFTDIDVPLEFTIDTDMYTGPTNEIQLDFYPLLRDACNRLYKHPVPISFVR